MINLEKLAADISNLKRKAFDAGYLRAFKVVTETLFAVIHNSKKNIK